jgi:methylated-DNA-[protein]-cysteine S-methyltransferase
MSFSDIIYADILRCYIELIYEAELCSIRFLKSEKKLIEKKTQNESLELEEYFKGLREDFSCEPDISSLSTFAGKVLDETRRIKYGTTITYSELADRIGSRAVRAVGRALSNNPFPIIIPCHRIVAKRGIGGYSAGSEIKKKLLEFEKTVNNFNNL